MKLADVQSARRQLAPVIRRTPLRYSGSISGLLGREVYFKFENLQRTGSFKIRGAYNKMCRLTPDIEEVVAASAGNHAQGVAVAAAVLGLKATVFMPREAPKGKIRAAEGYGARVVLAGHSYDEAYAEARRKAGQAGVAFIPAFDDPLIVAGQGTIGFEVLESLPDVAAVLVPVGGGGLIGGIGFVIKTLKPDTRVIGITTRHAPAALLSGQTEITPEEPVKRTIADGIAVKRPGVLPLELIADYIDEVVPVDEHLIAQAVLLLFSRTKTVVEGAGAVGLAAMLGGGPTLPEGKVLIILSGGNIDPVTFARIAENRKNMPPGQGKSVWRRNFLQ